MVLERDGLSSEAFRLQALECGHRGLTSLVDDWALSRGSPAEEGI
jgi:PTS system N-acetylgalactosamine-specific IIA component